MAVIWIYCNADTFESISWNNSAISLYNIQFSININNNKTKFLTMDHYMVVLTSSLFRLI